MVRYVPLHSYKINDRRRRRHEALQKLSMGAAGGLMIGLLVTLPFLIP